MSWLPKRRGPKKHRRLLGLTVGAAALGGSAACMPLWFLPFIAEQERYYAEVRKAVEALPSVSVRIVNNTDKEAAVSLASSIKPPVDPPSGFMGPFYGGTDYMESADSQSVRVQAGGTATGSLKCGDAISVSAVTGANPDLYGPSVYMNGIYLNSGDIDFSGLGRAGEGTFSGAVLSSVRTIRPAEDGVDCGSATIVITIQTPSTGARFDPNTGERVSDPVPGTGTVGVE